MAGDDQWTADDLEAAYQRALAMVDSLDDATALAAADHLDILPFPERPADAARPRDGRNDGRGAVDGDWEEPLQLPSASGRRQSADAAEVTPPPFTAPRVSRRQIVEAALFVGGRPLSSRSLASLLGDGIDTDTVAGLIDEINANWLHEGRPYYVCLDEGGYRIELHAEYEGVRARVYGRGPREIRLSQEALEVLSLVAYRQPIDKAAIEEALRRRAGSTLNLLLRLELVVIERTGEDRHDVVYRTTHRFLELFGLAGLDELPRAEDLSFK